MPRTNRTLIAALLILAAVVHRPLIAQEADSRLPDQATEASAVTSSGGRVPETDNASTSVAPPMDVVIRVSKELFEVLTRDVVEMTIPIRHDYQGMPMVGEASGKGYTTVEMPDSDGVAELVLSVSGDAVGRMRADAGPAYVHLSSRSAFVTRKRIRFDGEVFSADPTDTVASNCSSIDAVCAKRRGPIGKIVQGIGKKIAQKSLVDANRQAEKMTRDVLTSKFDETGVDLLASLNTTTDIEKTIYKYFPESKSWKFRTLTRGQMLWAGIGEDLAGMPDTLPSEPGSEGALVEVWLRTTPGQAALLQMIADLDVGYDLLREEIPDEESDDILNDVQLVRRGDWSVILMGVSRDKASDASASDTGSAPDSAILTTRN